MTSGTTLTTQTDQRLIKKVIAELACLLGLVIFKLAATYVADVVGVVEIVNVLNFC